MAAIHLQRQMCRQGHTLSARAVSEYYYCCWARLKKGWQCKGTNTTATKGASSSC